VSAAGGAERSNVAESKRLSAASARPARTLTDTPAQSAQRSRLSAPCSGCNRHHRRAHLRYRAARFPEIRKTALGR